MRHLLQSHRPNVWSLCHWTHFARPQYTYGELWYTHKYTLIQTHLRLIQQCSFFLAWNNAKYTWSHVLWTLVQVLAHRGGLWTSLQWVCRILWDQFADMALLVECSQIFDSATTLTLDQFYTMFTPLLVLASDLLMDMMERRQVGLYFLYILDCPWYWLLCAFLFFIWIIFWTLNKTKGPFCSFKNCLYQNKQKSNLNQHCEFDLINYFMLRSS